MYKALQKSVANGAEGSTKAGKFFREALQVVSGVLGVWRAVLKSVKSLQSPTEKSCERRGRQRKGRKNLQTAMAMQISQSRAGTKMLGKWVRRARKAFLKAVKSLKRHANV